ncbi:RNA-directed DNA polymerase, eukaryota, nucleotide-binding alpha-beta plait domain protein [Tanacetum coccineum]
MSNDLEPERMVMITGGVTDGADDTHVDARFSEKKSENAAVQAHDKEGTKADVSATDWSANDWSAPKRTKMLPTDQSEADTSAHVSSYHHASMVTHRSMEDHVIRISKSVFVTNFPDAYGSRDLWKLCETYGKVVDVFIPNRLSKAGKRFAFVRFIKVDDIDRLLSNLCTLWVGRFHIHANAVRYERPSKPHHPHPQPRVHSRPSPGSFAVWFG